MNLRRIIQIIASIIQNSYIPGLINGTIYQGALKKGCTPILNCWGCPLAWQSCPLGALQHFVGLKLIPFYILGFFGSIGMIIGRMSCGWVCPFGFLQDLLFKLKSVKMKLPTWCSYIKYGVLIGVAVIVAYFTAEPWFCKLCPDGALLAGIPLVLSDPVGDLRALIGWHFYMKVAILVIVILFSIPIKRFFCRTLCPIGAIYSIFNRFSFLQIKIDKEKCIECESCQMICPMHVPIWRSPKNIDCIRCLDCVKICPTKAITHGPK
jgi:ferredoxin-type protein NapH